MVNALVEKGESSFLPIERDLDGLKYYANMVYSSGLIPSSLLKEDDTKDKILAKISIVFLKGYELNIRPMQSLAEIGVVNGQPVISSKLMLALIYRDVPTAEIIYDEISSQKCVLRARRYPHHQFTKFEYSFDYATKAGLVQRNSHTWKKFPRQMLKWRTVSNMARTLFPDVIMGCFLPGEIPIQNPKTSFGTNIEEMKLSDDDEKKLSSIEFIDAVDNDFESDDLVTEDQTTDISGLTPQQLYELSLPEEEDKNNPLNLVMDLQLDISEKKLKKIKTPELKKVEDKPKKPKIQAVSNPKKVIKKPDIKKKTISIKKPTVTSAMDKIKNISKSKPIKKTDKPVLKKLGGINKLSVPVKKKETNTIQSLNPKDLMDPDFYFSAGSSDKMGEDLPWNLLKDIISPVINTEDHNTFNIEISKYFKQYLMDASPGETIGRILLDAYNQYCEIDLQEVPIDAEAELHKKIGEIIKKMYAYLDTIKETTINKTKFTKDILKKIGLTTKYSEWVVGFLESRELISISSNSITVL